MDRSVNLEILDELNLVSEFRALIFCLQRVLVRSRRTSELNRLLETLGPRRDQIWLVLDLILKHLWDKDVEEPRWRSFSKTCQISQDLAGDLYSIWHNTDAFRHWLKCASSGPIAGTTQGEDILPLLLNNKVNSE